MKKHLLLTLLFAATSFAQTTKQAAPSAPPPTTYALKAARMFDAEAGKMVQPGLVVVSGGKIQSVGGAAPAGATVIDLGDATLLPGFIDAHTHLTFDYDTDYNGAILKGMQRTPAELAIRATANAKATLMAGFTTVRDVGSGDFVDIGLRNAINAGIVPGPRMLVAMNSLGATGGHCDASAGFRHGLFDHESAPRDGTINNPDEARYAVRFNLKYGADVIKVCATGGVLSMNDAVDTPQLTQAELDAIVDEARALRHRTAAHAHGAEGAKRAIRAGIHSIEHGTFLDDEAFTMMKEKGTYFVPTLATRIGLERGNFPPFVREKANRAVKQQAATLKRAYDMGVKIAFGSDAGVYPHGENAAEFIYLVDYGMPVIAALQTGTVHSADLLGLAEKIGSLKAGKNADVVAVPGDPSADIRLTQKVFFVMKDGQVYRHDKAVAAK